MQLDSGRVIRAMVGAATLFLLTAMPSRASHFHRGPTSSRHKGKASGAAHAAVAHPRAIDDARATEIQAALVKAGYLQSSSGKWDDASADAMRKLQNDNGWQTKLIPDSRALIKLGLGPGSEASASNLSGGLSESNGAAVHRDAISSTLVK